MNRHTTRVLTGLLLAAVLLLAACVPGQAEPLPYVDLSRGEPLPAVSLPDVAPLRVAVAAIISPEGTIESYSDLASYLSEKLGRPVQLVQRRTYAEVNDLIAAGDVDLAFVCTSAYVAGRERFGMELLVAPEVNGQTVYYSVLIVPQSSAATSMADLRGAVFAFTDPMSHSGRVYPTYLVQQLNATPDTFFRRTFFTYSHDQAILAVASGVADGAAVDSLVLDYAFERDPSLRARVKIIHRSPPFGIPPVVVPPGLSPRERALLRGLFLEMDEDPRGRAVLAALGIDRFVLLSDGAYDSVRDLWRLAGAAP